MSASSGHGKRRRSGAVVWSSNAVFPGINDVGNAQWTALAGVGSAAVIVASPRSQKSSRPVVLDG